MKWQLPKSKYVFCTNSFDALRASSAYREVHQFWPLPFTQYGINPRFCWHVIYIYILSNAVDLMCLPCFFLVFVVYKLTLIRTLPPERFTLTTPATLAQLRSTLQCDSAGTSGSDVGTAQPETDEARCLSWRMYLYRERLEKDPCKYDRICSWFLIC